MACCPTRYRFPAAAIRRQVNSQSASQANSWPSTCSHKTVHRKGPLSPSVLGESEPQGVTTIMNCLLAPAASLALALCLAAALRAEQMYNLQFDQAHGTFAEWQRLHPDDPMGPASDATAYLFTEFDPLPILQPEFFVQDETRSGLGPRIRY